jgi:putative mRNA 3-end processing factor
LTIGARRIANPPQAASLPHNGIVDLLELRPEGLYCPAGDFYIDPWGAVDRAVITHAHADRVSLGSHAYLTAAPGELLLRDRVGSVQGVAYGERLTMGDVIVSLHPAGHILGSAQVRIERAGEVWVVSGDFKLAPDPTCAPFELLRCHTFVAEAAFALPIYRWPEPAEAFAAIRGWWRANEEAGKASVLYAHPVGLAQRLVAELGPVALHAEIERWCTLYRAAGIDLPESRPDATLSLAPPGWKPAAGRVSTAMASGWMRIRGTRRRRSLDRGFVISDHADWPGLLRVIDETGASGVWVASGYRGPLVRWLAEHGREARAIETNWEGAES